MSDLSATDLTVLGVLTEHSNGIRPYDIAGEAGPAVQRVRRALLRTSELHELLDLDRPVAIRMFAVLHFVEDVDDPYGVVDIWHRLGRPPPGHRFIAGWRYRRRRRPTRPLTTYDSGHEVDSS